MSRLLKALFLAASLMAAIPANAEVISANGKAEVSIKANKGDAAAAKRVARNAAEADAVVAAIKLKLNIDPNNPKSKAAIADMVNQLTDNLKGAHAAVFFNSSASVAAVCAGIPVFVDDVSCVAWNVANRDIAKIESPATFAREQWLYDLSAAHWSDADAQAGRIWQKFLPYLASTTTS